MYYFLYYVKPKGGICYRLRGNFDLRCRSRGTREDYYGRACLTQKRRQKSAKKNTERKARSKESQEKRQRRL